MRLSHSPEMNFGSYVTMIGHMKGGTRAVPPFLFLAFIPRFIFLGPLRAT